MTRNLLLALAVLLAAGGAQAGETSTQTSPLATEPLPTQGGGQAAMGAAVTGSAPNAEQTASPTDNSQAQGGALLKPGTGAADMDAASGKTQTK